MLNKITIQNICRAALAEDIGSGDATTLAIVPENLIVTARLITREECICAGMQLAETIFNELDPQVSFESLVAEGQLCKPGEVMAEITGQAQALLTGERTALNYLQRLCGIATMANCYVAAVGGAKTKILDTRKTTPGWRELEKYAVKMGGAINHRFGLYDRIMIKDNHRALAQAIQPEPIISAVAKCRELYPDIEVEVEADTMQDVEDAVAAGADYILLDNMSNDEMAEAIKVVNGRSLLEASGGITLERIPSIAALGVDFISVGALTHSVKATDISLDIQVDNQ